MDKEKGMFILTQRLKTAIEIINRVDISRFPLIVSRIAKKVHLKGDEQQAFSKTEQKQLEVVLGLSAADVSSLLESTAFILEQAAYYIANAATLEQQLTKIGVDAPHTAAFQKVWEMERENVLLGLRDRTLVPKVLSDVNWQLHLHMAQSDLTRVKQPVALFELKLKSTEESKNTIASADAKKDTKVAVEFTHDELYKFYHQLEKIQEQLDQLS